jgi:hypothetical protein
MRTNLSLLLLLVTRVGVMVATRANSHSHPERRWHPRSIVGRAVHAARASSRNIADGEAAAFEQSLQSGVPAGLPGRNDRSRSLRGPVVNILDYNVSNDGTRDVSAAILRVAAQHRPRAPNGQGACTLLFPPGTYLIDPPANVTSGGFAYRTNGGPFQLPAFLALELAEGALLRTRDALLRVLVAGPLSAGYTQHIFDVAPKIAVKLDANGTVAQVQTPEPHGFKTGDRFFIDSASTAFSGGWSVCGVVDSHTFQYQMLHDPFGGDPGSPLLYTAVWYFSSKLWPNQNIFRGTPTPQEWVTPEWWGAVDSVWADSTVAVQSAMDSAARGILLLSTYQVRRVTLQGFGRLLEGRGGGFSAMTNARPNPLQLQPTGTLNAVFEIKCSYSKIHNLAVSAAFNGTYTAAVHWYTNDESIWSVEFNRIQNMHITFAKIAFLVGAAPGQDPKYFPTPGQNYPYSGTAPDGVAVNAALSESYIDGLNLRGTERGFMMSQPNGFLHMSNSFLYASSQGWMTEPDGNIPGFDWSCACPLDLRGEFGLLIDNTDLELNQAGEFQPGDSGLRIANATGSGTLGLRDTCIEAQGSFHIGGSVSVSWEGNDDGYETMPYPTFEIADDATGSLLIRNARWYRPSGWSVNLPAALVARRISRAYPHSFFSVILDNVVLYDFPWRVLPKAVSPSKPDPPFEGPPPPPPTGYLSLTRGVLTEVRDVTLITRLCVNDSLPLHQDGSCVHGTNVVAAVTQIRPGVANMLRSAIGGVDVAAATLPTDPRGCISSGGWTVTNSSTQHDEAFYALTTPTDLPQLFNEVAVSPQDIIQKGMVAPFTSPPTVTRAMRLRSAPGNSLLMVATNRTVAVSPAAQLVLTGWVRTNGVGRIVVYSDWEDYMGRSCSDARATMLTAFEAGWIGFNDGAALWEPLLLRLESAGSASWLRLRFAVSDGAVLDLYDLGLH